MSKTGTHANVLGSEFLTRDDPFARQVREKVESVLEGLKRLDEVVGATSIRCAVGLILGRLEGATTLNEEEAWDYLDPGNQELVIFMREYYRDRAQRWLMDQARAEARSSR